MLQHCQNNVYKEENAMIVPSYYEDLHMLHENTMPDRSYYVPAAVRMDGLDEER